jgi:hypothetical protein
VSALARARLVFWTIVAFVVLLIVLAFAIPTETRQGFDWLTAFVAVYGAAAAGVVRWVGRRPLRATDASALAKAYAGRVMLCAAIAETPVAIGFAGTLVAGVPWPALLGGAWGLAALSFVAPTDADLERRQQELTASGSTLSLREALGAA